MFYPKLDKYASLLSYSMWILTDRKEPWFRPVKYSHSQICLVLILALTVEVWCVLILNCVFSVYVLQGKLREEHYRVDSIDIESPGILEQQRENPQEFSVSRYLLDSYEKIRKAASWPYGKSVWH